jgi:broad specificity phosphatase PhoE
MRLFLLRHGNTFAPGQTPVMVGAHDDVPLVARGFEQAEACGRTLAALGIRPTAVFAAPLQRTRAYALKVLAVMAGAELPTLTLDERLREVDYGPWTGQSDAQLLATVPDELRAWREEGRWPAAFGTRAAQAQEAVRGFLGSLAPDATALAVTSAGVLRAFLEQDADMFDQRRSSRSLGFKTGHLGLWEDGKILFWDLPPDEFQRRMS